MGAGELKSPAGLGGLFVNLASDNRRSGQRLSWRGDKCRSVPGTVRAVAGMLKCAGGHRSLAIDYLAGMNRILLWLVMLPAPLWAKLGADVPQLRAILDARFRLDDRRPLNGITRPNAQKRRRRFAILLSMLVSLFSGMIFTLAMAMNDDRSGLFFYFGIFMLMLSFMLISDFSSVLVDTRDKYVVLPAPVTGRTLFLARILHIGAYFMRTIIPMSVPGIVVIARQHGALAALWFLLPVLLMAATAMFIVMAVYLLILSIASQSRFKEILSYFQIGFSILVFGCYYLLPRLIDRSNFMSFSVDDYPWLRFTPPYWLVSLYGWVHPMGAGSWTSGILAIVLPVVLIVLTVRVMAPRFTRILGSLDVVEAGDQQPGAVSRRAKRAPFRDFFSRVFNRTQISRAAFEFVWLQTGRSRSFKMRVYPAMASVPIMTLAPILLNSHKLEGGLQALAGTNLHIVLLYVCTLFLVQVLAALAVSDQYKASWIYRASPVEAPGEIIAAGYKVVLARFILPFYLICAAAVLYVWGARAIADVLLALVNVTLYGWIVVRLVFRKLPFSELSEDTGGGSRFLMGLLSLFVGGLLGIAHYLTFDFLTLKLLFLVLSSIAIWLVEDSVRTSSWAAIRSKD